MSRHALTTSLQPFGDSIYATMSALAQRCGAVNLAQGFTEADGPESVRQMAADALVRGPNQYVSPRGIPALREAISRKMQRFAGVLADPEIEVVVTAGAQAALAAAFSTLLEPGDEVIVLEPFYNPVVPLLALARAQVRFVSLAGDGFELPEQELRAAFSARTRAVVINSPNNPSGRVLSRAEMEVLAGLCVEHDAYLISDEVYEHMVFDGGEHTCALTLPGMRERAIVVSSISKTLSLTGWRIGYAVASPPLAEAIAFGQQLVGFCQPGPLQEAAAAGLELGDDFYAALCADMQHKRDLFCDGLRELGIDVTTPGGTYFCAADIRSLGADDDLELCQRLPDEAGVAAIPMSLSWSERRQGRHLIRFCFGKEEETLREALARLGRWRGRRA